MSTSAWSVLVLVVFLFGLILGLQLGSPDPRPDLAGPDLVPVAESKRGSGNALRTVNPSAERLAVDDPGGATGGWPESKLLAKPVAKTSVETLIETGPDPVASVLAEFPETTTVRDLYRAFGEAMVAGKTRRAGMLRQRMLDDFPYEGFTRLADAEWLYRRGGPGPAIKALIEHRPLERDKGVLRLLDKHLYSWLPTYLVRLRDRDDNASYLSFLRYLIVAWPTKLEYQWKLAQALFGFKQYQETLLTLETLIYDPVWGQRALALQTKALRRQELLAAYDLQLPLHRQGKSLIVGVRLNGVARARLIVDTGAELTLLTPEAVARAGMDVSNPVREVKLGTVSGVVPAPVIAMEMVLEGLSGADGRAIVDGGTYHVAVYASPLRDGTDGLLGMDVLQGYRFFIDQEQQLLLLQPRF
jgi:predicted aspartyl protease